MELTAREADMIRAGLLALANDYRREAKSRRWTGPRWAEVREQSRATAREYETLAERVTP